MDSEILTREELADKMKVSVSTVKNWERDPAFPALSAGKNQIRRYVLGDVIAYLKTRNEERRDGQ